MSVNNVISGYLEVKISSKSRRGLTPWKAWQKQWCEIRRLDTVENGVELKLKSDKEGSVLSCVILPRSSTICRTESRTRQYSFGVFHLGRNKKPIIYMSGSSESDSQEWMSSIRRMLSVASYIPVGDSNFRVSLIDNEHSRTAGLIGLYGVLGLNSQGMMISDPCTGESKLKWKWFQFHQFHLQAPVQPVDDQKIIVMHSSGDFPAGAGQLYLYCKEGQKLLNHLTARGKMSKSSPSLMAYKRLSRSEGDIYSPNFYTCITDSPVYFRSQTSSEDSGVRVSDSFDDSEYMVNNSKTSSSAQPIGMSLITKTPGGSENEDLSKGLSNIEEEPPLLLPRNKSGISLASGIYEEIPDGPKKSPNKDVTKFTTHIYENPLELRMNVQTKDCFVPPPLPPRRLELNDERPARFSSFLFSPFKQRCNTLPAKDLSKISQMFNGDSEYVVMSPSKTLVRPKKPSISESLYIPMSPVINLGTKIVESYYMSMNGKRS